MNRGSLRRRVTEAGIVVAHWPAATGETATRFPASVPAEKEVNPRREKARKAIEDTLQTSQLRLTNLTKARENHELVQLEIERLEHKIRSVAEMAVNRQEPDFISDQVDVVTKSLIETEKTMDELDFATGLGEVEEVVPELTSRRATEKQR